MRYFLIMNPGSKSGSSKKRFRLIHNLLEENGIEYHFELTKSLEHAYELSVEANRAGFDAIVAVGGDGTINRVLNGFYHPDGTRAGKAKFGVVYTGTSPDFCKSYNIPLDTKRAVRAVITGHSKQIGIGRIEFGDGIKYFACCANIGLGATLANNANSGIRKYLGDYAGTFAALIKTFCVYKPITVLINGKPITNVYNISVGKTFYVASGLKIRNDLAPLDNRFYMLVINRNIPGYLWKMYIGAPIALEYVNEIKIDGAGAVEFDGDEGGTLPVTITAAEPLDVICGGAL